MENLKWPRAPAPLRSRASPVADVLYVQQTAGNRATARLLSSERSRPDSISRATDEDRATGTAGVEDGGHDLKAERFAGDPVLEACFDGIELKSSH